MVEGEEENLAKKEVAKNQKERKEEVAKNQKERGDEVKKNDKYILLVLYCLSNRLKK